MTKQEKQDILLEVAMAFYRRGTSIQYNQLSMDRVVRVTPRRQRGISPESATPQQLCFLDCSSFVWSVYHEAFGIELKSDLTWYMTELSDIRAFYHVLSHKETKEEEKAILTHFHDTLEPGDIIVYAREQGTSGHAMLYIGNDRILHCTARGGGDYDYKLLKNRISPYGGLFIDSIDCLLCKWEDSVKTPRSLFQPSLRCFAILRPQVQAPTENTLRRMENCRGLDLTVLSSVFGGQTAAIDDEIEYTVVIKNNNDLDKNLSVTFAAPSGTEMLCDPQKQVFIPAEKESRIPFRVRLTKDASPLLDAPVVKVCGFTVATPKIKIGKRITKEQTEQLLKDYASAYAEESDAFQAAVTAYGKQELPIDSEPLSRLFILYDALSGDVLYRKPQQPGMDMAVYSLFGGSGVITPEMAFDGDIRTRYISESDLMPGDIILTADNALFTDTKAFFYDGEALCGNGEKLTDEAKTEFIDSLLGRFVFVVLRPFLYCE